MSPSRLCLRLRCLHLVLLLGGLVSCGPASPDNAPGVEPRASISQPTHSEQPPAADINSPTSATPAANPGSLASENGAGSGDGLVVPAWMANELASPNVPLETGAQLEPTGAVDPIIQALNDKEVGAEELFEEQENLDGNEGQENPDHEEEGEK